MSALGLVVGTLIAAAMMPAILVDKKGTVTIEVSQIIAWDDILAVQLIEFDSGFEDEISLRYQWNLVSQNGSKLERYCLIQEGAPNLIGPDAARLAAFLDVPLQQHWLPKEVVKESFQSLNWVPCIFGIGAVFFLFLLSWVLWKHQPQGMDLLFLGIGLMVPVGFLFMIAFALRCEQKILRVRDQ